MNRKRWLASGVALLALSAPLPSLARTWKVDAEHSTLAFTNAYQGVQYQGQFHRFTATIDYDPGNPANAKFDVTVDITSLDTRNSERDHTALGGEFFDAAQFPRAHFVTTSFRKMADGKVLADGTLTLRGVSKPIELAVTFAPHGDSATLEVTARLRRLDFGIGAGDWADPSMIGNDVTVHGLLALHADRQGGDRPQGG